jgi:uncharacterized surface protein with fasciclin (FAS1) repeats
MKDNKNMYIVLALIALGLGGYLIFNQVTGKQAMTENKQVQDNNNKVVEKKIIKEEKMEINRNIVQIAAADSRFSTLVTAVSKAGLVDALSGEGPYTVFAPTNDAFAKLPKETLDAVLADTEQLTSILTYHVVKGKVMSKDVVNLTSADTLQGGALKIKVEGSIVMVNNAKVIITDIEASNGVIHVIDTVLIPQ